VAQLVDAAQRLAPQDRVLYHHHRGDDAAQLLASRVAPVRYSPKGEGSAARGG